MPQLTGQIRNIGMFPAIRIWLQVPATTFNGFNLPRQLLSELHLQFV